jgi:F-type H+-transporting ATPase subunit delta
MADVAAAKRYAQAAFEIASEEGAIARWRGELDDIAAVLTDSQLAPMFADSRVPLDRRLSGVERALDISPKALNLAKLLVQKGRSLDARAVANAFGRMADAAEGIAHAQVTTAVPLSADQLQAISARLSSQLGKDVRTTGAVDPSILGGIVVKVGDRLVDGSVKTRLKRLRRELEGAR